MLTDGRIDGANESKRKNRCLNPRGPFHSRCSLDIFGFRAFSLRSLVLEEFSFQKAKKLNVLGEPIDHQSRPKQNHAFTVSYSFYKGHAVLKVILDDRLEVLTIASQGT